MYDNNKKHWQAYIPDHVEEMKDMVEKSKGDEKGEKARKEKREMVKRGEGERGREWEERKKDGEE